MRREIKEKRKAETRKYLEDIRYIRILDDCIISINESTVSLKKGDIVRIYNNQIEDLVFNKSEGILSQLGYRNNSEKTKSHDLDLSQDFRLKKYPKDDALDILKYLEIQPKVKLTKQIEISLWIKENSVYLTQEFLNRMIEDESNIELLNGESISTSEYNRRNIISAFKKGIQIIKYEPGNNLLPFFGDGSNDKDRINDKEKKEVGTFCVPPTLEDFKPGIYKSKTEKSFIPLTLILYAGEVIDFSKLEFALLALNQDFMKLLVRSEEITSLREKERIYKSEQKGFFGQSNIKYYRVKKTVNLNEQDVEYLTRHIDRFGRTTVGHGYDIDRVWGNITAVETENERVKTIKVEFTNPAIYGIMDKEIRKIARRMNERESFHTYLNERNEKQRKIEEERIKRMKIKKDDYFRTKMLADLAKSYTMDKKYIDWNIEEDKFKEDAWNFYEKRIKQYNRTREVLGSELTVEEFYMMYQIRSRFRDNRNIDNEYQMKIKENQRRLLQILSEKGEYKTR